MLTLLRTQTNPVFFAFFHTTADCSVFLNLFEKSFLLSFFFRKNSLTVILNSLASSDFVTYFNQIISSKQTKSKETNTQEKPSSFVSLSGGWVVYEKNNFKGRQLFYFDGNLESG